MRPTPEFQVQFLQNLQRLLSEGQFVATYKFALLLALADISVEKGDDSGDPLPIETRLIAEKFISYYWRQSLPYIPRNVESENILRQNTAKQAAIVRHIQQVRDTTGGSLTDARADPRTWNSLLRDVDAVVRVMPLWKLQTVVGGQPDFLYENTGHGTSIELRTGVGFCFRQFYGLVSELVRGAWVRYIRRQNHDLLGTTADLVEFLFGSERANLAMVQPILADLQGGECFYCRAALRSRSSHVDHFIPWSRYPVDLGHNFVLCHGSCNSAKADHLAAAEHLDAWAERNAKFGTELADEFSRMDVIHDLPASVRIASWAYSQVVVSGSLTWLRRGEMLPLRPGWQSVLEALG